MHTCDIALIIIICAAIITVKYIDKLSFLDHIFIKYNNFILTGWSISHYLTYFIIGYLCYEQFQTYIMISILWEIFEKYYGKITNNELYWTSSGIQGQLLDIIMNILGFISGNYIKSFIQ